MGDAAGELDVTIGAGASSLISFPGSIFVGDFGAGTGNLRAVANIIAGGDISGGGTLNVSGDTSSGDAAAIGRTAAEGLILTGQGSTNDITIKNDADAAVLQIPTGTVNVIMAGDLSVAGSTTLSGGLSLSSATASNPVVEIKNTTADASAGILKLTKDRGAAGVAGDDAGLIQFFGEDDGENPVMFSEIKSEANVVTDGEEGGKFTVSVASNDGTSTDGLIIVDGDAAGELDVTIGAGASSIIQIPGSVAVIGSIGVIGDIATTSTLVATGDTSAGDDGAIGRTAAEGLILTGQGTTNDITIKNDADAAVLEIPTGTTNVVVAGNVTATGDLVVTGNDITFGNSETISNSTDNTVLITSLITKTSAALEVGSKLTVAGDLDLVSSTSNSTRNVIAGRITVTSGAHISGQAISNTYVTDDSIIMLSWATDISDKDSALRIWLHAQEDGAFTIKVSSNANGEKFNFLVIN